MIPKFAIGAGGMIKILEGQYESTEFKFKNSIIVDKNLSFDTEFTNFYIDNISYTTTASDDDFNMFVENVASNIIKKILYDASTLTV